MSDDRSARGIDPRGPRFAAAITSLLLLIAVFLGLTGLSTAQTTDAQWAISAASVSAARARSRLPPRPRDRPPLPVGDRLAADGTVGRPVPQGRAAATHGPERARGSAAAALRAGRRTLRRRRSASSCSSSACRGRSRSPQPPPSSPPSSTPRSACAWAACSTCCSSGSASSAAHAPRRPEPTLRRVAPSSQPR